MATLPNQLNYGGHASVPRDTTSQQIVVRPSNGSLFKPSGQIQLDLPMMNFLVGSTMAIRYQIEVDLPDTTPGSARTASMLGIPVYTPFQRLQTMFNGQTKEDINDYNQILHYLINSQYDSAMKSGLPSYGFLGVDASETVIQEARPISYAIGVTKQTLSLSAPLPCCLSMIDGDKFLPLDTFSSLRINLNLDTINNMFGETNKPTDYTIKNFELVFNVCTFNQDIKDMLLNSEPLIVKTQSFNSISQVLQNSASGTNDLTFAHHFDSIKSLHALFAKNDNTLNPNKKFESRDPNLNSIQFMVGGLSYPQLGLDIQNAKSYVLMENKKTWNALGTTDFNPSISLKEFSVKDSDTSTFAIPGKFYVSTPTERVLSNGYLLSGINSKQSQISLRLNINNPVTSNYNVNTVAIYDMLLRIDPQTKQVDALV
jgi:hypothetical protein